MLRYKGPSFEAVKPDGRSAYRGPLRRAQVWARIHGGSVEPVNPEQPEETTPFGWASGRNEPRTGMKGAYA